MALKTLKLTLTGDLELDRLSKPTVLLGRDAIEQIVKTTFSLHAGNWFRDQDRGIPWDRILVKLFNRRTIIQLLQQALLKNENIEEVVEITVEVVEDRQVNIGYFVIADGQLVTGVVTV